MSNKIINIAIIDDENEIIEMIEKYLSRQGGYKITTFLNPQNAITYIDNKVDVILLDIMMPQMNGIEVLSELQKKNIDAKVIMMTAYSTLDKVLKSHREGAADYIMKPFSSLKVLEEKIKEVLL